MLKWAFGKTSQIRKINLYIFTLEQSCLVKTEFVIIFQFL